MAEYEALTDQELDRAIAETAKSIERAQDTLKGFKGQNLSEALKDFFASLVKHELWLQAELNQMVELKQKREQKD